MEKFPFSRAIIWAISERHSGNLKGIFILPSPQAHKDENFKELFVNIWAYKIFVSCYR